MPYPKREIVWWGAAKEVPFWILVTAFIAVTISACTEEEKEAFKNAVVDRAKCAAAKAAHKEGIVSDDWYASAVAKCKAAGINI